jgi:hypothetical protein
MELNLVKQEIKLKLSVMAWKLILLNLLDCFLPLAGKLLDQTPALIGHKQIINEGKSKNIFCKSL